jgi:predicted enzyme related to lactoylglutathione lyase
MRPARAPKSIARERLILREPRICTGKTVTSRVVHLELRTPNLGAGCAFYSGLLGWLTRREGLGDASYQSLDIGARIGGGVVECGTERALWLPYVEVDSVTMTTEHAVMLGASVMLAPREGPVGWRSVVTTPAGGEIALWQPKR